MLRPNMGWEKTVVASDKRKMARPLGVGGGGRGLGHWEGRGLPDLLLILPFEYLQIFYSFTELYLVSRVCNKISTEKYQCMYIHVHVCCIKDTCMK